jgi:hypothetical protein
MKCEEFQAIGLERADWTLTGADAAEYLAAMEHVIACSHCAALQEAWLKAQSELRKLGAATQGTQAPGRVEMRLRQEFRRKHRTAKARAAAVFGSWVLATATLLLCAISWWNWQVAQHAGVQSANNAGYSSSPKGTSAEGGTNNPTNLDQNATGKSSDQAALVADNEDGDFTLLPGSLPQETEDAAILRVRLQRGALGALGLPVNQERAGEWLQVDLLVGEDGQPRAVRLPAQTSR